MTVIVAAILMAFSFALGWRTARHARTVTVYAVRTGRDPYYVNVDLFRDRAEAEAFHAAAVKAEHEPVECYNGDPVFSTFILGPSGPAVETEDAR
jgi:hypothetical protein